MDNGIASATFRTLETPEMFPLLPALAERLGVTPGEHGGRVMLNMRDGTSYDLFALINAFLDRADAVQNDDEKIARNVEIIRRL